MKNILTIDVEEVFHAEYARDLTGRENVFRTPYNLARIIKLLDEHSTKATFFIVGEVAEKYPSLIKEIVDGGHEVAFHSYDHKPLWEKTPDQLEKEIADFNTLSRSIIGEKCRGFRAPSFSLDNRTKWAVKVLERTGISYDSSIFPAWTPLYGLLNAPLNPYNPSKEDLAEKSAETKLWEFPLATYLFLWFRIPAAGGFYLRFMPNLVRKAIIKMNKSGMPAVVYVHNWELDPETPKLKLGLISSFVTYHNINKTERKLQSLLTSFNFTSIRGYMDNEGFAGAWRL